MYESDISFILRDNLCIVDATSLMCRRNRYLVNVYNMVNFRSNEFSLTLSMTVRVICDTSALLFYFDGCCSFICDEYFISHSRCAFSEITRWHSPQPRHQLRWKNDNEDFVDWCWSIFLANGSSCDVDAIRHIALKAAVSIIIIGELQSGACSWLQVEASKFYLGL